MPPIIALLACLVTIFVLMRLDIARAPEVSKAIWIPFIWMLILCTRLPAQWLNLMPASQAEAFAEGSPLDRTVYLTLTLIAVGILVSRRAGILNLLKGNIALSVLILLGLASVAWSDFPFITFKRWFRDLGGFLMIGVVLSESSPVDAVTTLLRRLSYVVIPLSVVLIKYYPNIGRGFDRWSGIPQEVGVTSSKNILGVLCLLSMLLFFWDTLRRWSNRSDRQTRQVLFLNFIFLGMTLWLLNRANSSTSTLCVALGCSFLALSHTRFIQPRPARLKVLIPLVLSLYFILDWGFDIRSIVVSLAGRDSTLTGRTDLWEYLSTVDVNWLLGTGYESFWLGSRFENALARFQWGPTQAHNGYREMYLNLGMLGLSVVFVLLFTSYRKICKGLTVDFGPALLGLTLWITVLCYDVTEAAFRLGHPLWLSFLLVSLSIPSLRTQPVHSRRLDLSRNQRFTPQIRPIPQLKTTEQRSSYRLVEKRSKR